MRTETLADGIVLYLGDCREILPTLEHFDCVITDPPYGVAYSSGWNNKFKKVTIANDATPEIRDWLVDQVGDGRALIFGSWKVPKPKNTKMVLIWDKGTVGSCPNSSPSVLSCGAECPNFTWPIKSVFRGERGALPSARSAAQRSGPPPNATRQNWRRQNPIHSDSRPSMPLLLLALSWRSRP